MNQPTTQFARGEDHPNAKLTAECVAEIRRRSKTETLEKLAEDFGVSFQCIHSVISRRTWPDSAKYAQKLNEDSVRAIKARTANRRAYHGEPLKALAADFGVSIGAISGIIKGRTWTHIT